MKNFLSLIFVTSVLLVYLCGCGITETPAEDFSYEMEDDEVVITGYKGTDLEIRIPEYINERPVTEIDEDSFACYDMSKIVIPKTVKEINENAFRECACLTYVSINEGLEHIGSGAFDECVSLDEINIPENTDIYANMKTAIVDGRSYIELDLPTIYIMKVLDQLYTNDSEALQAIVNEESIPTMSIIENSKSHKELQKLEKEHDVDLKELGIYKIK